MQKRQLFLRRRRLLLLSCLSGGTVWRQSWGCSMFHVIRPFQQCRDKTSIWLIINAYVHIARADLRMFAFFCLLVFLFCCHTIWINVHWQQPSLPLGGWKSKALPPSPQGCSWSKRARWWERTLRGEKTKLLLGWRWWRLFRPLMDYANKKVPKSWRQFGCISEYSKSGWLIWGRILRWKWWPVAKAWSFFLFAYLLFVEFDFMKYINFN